MKDDDVYYCKICNEQHVRKSNIGRDHYKKIIELDNNILKKYQKTAQEILAEASKVIVGQRDVLKQILIAVMSDGNALLEGYPGMAKTLMVKTMSDVMDLSFSRIQNTPDLMPTDITGTYIITETKGNRRFEFFKGPIFSNVVLADEINRATPKTQSAFLESMQERQVTSGNRTYELPKPFFVLATQNPIDQEGTYPLPEAQTDRFMFKILVSYPTPDEENEIVEKFTSELKPNFKLKKVVTRDKIIELQDVVRKVPISNDSRERIVEIVDKTRNHSLIEFGASPRASLSLVLAAKAHAIIEGRSYVSLEDIKAMAYPVLRHRLILSFEAEKQDKTADDIIKDILSEVK